MHETTTPDKPRILLVEDEAALREHLAQVLSDEYLIDAAGSGREALSAVLKTSPSLIVTDIVMPDIDGIELVKALRSTRRTEAIPVLLISGRARDEQRIEGFRQGADGYLAKPYTVPELRACIGSILKVARRRYDLAREHTEQQALADRAALLENMTDAFYALDRQARFTYLNQKALDHFGREPGELLGQVLWDVFPEIRKTVIQSEYERVLGDQCTVAFEVASPLSGRWVDVRAYPTSQGLAAHFRDATDRKRTEEQLRESDRRKTEFLAVLAHELRNPLAPLRTGLEILRERCTDAALSHTVGMMDRQLAHLVRLVDDLLDVAHIERARLELRRQRVLLTDALATAVEASRAFIEARHHDLLLDLSDKSPVVDADPDRLAQVFSNLLCNAAKYTDDGGQISLTLEREGKEAVVSIRDNGVGITPAALELIFDMFSQAGPPGSRAAKGLGIGLSLVRSLVQLHGGSVQAFSEGSGRGSTFIVRLPAIEAGAFSVSSAVAPTSGAADTARFPA
jgi:PAS domain S-box-containing protein